METGVPRREKGQILATRQSSQAYHNGCNVWVPETGIDMGNARQKVVRWVKGQVTGSRLDPSGKSLVVVRTEEGHERAFKTSELPLQNERDDIVDDLVKSDFLHEPGLLHTLRVRYALDMIYTYSGEILIAANPHKRLKQLYGPRMMAQYKGVPLGELSPHVYAIAEQAFSAMMVDDQQQAILVSGESGAGKTESAKMVMQYLAQRAGRSQRESHKPTFRTSAAAAPIEEQVLESNPLLEAFGNAKTVRNDNSSRFGKFTDMQFDVAGNVSGAAISTYLLERSRVVSINNPERSYHIFYQLCAGCDSEQKKALGLQGGAASFNYLSKSSTFTLPGVDDAEGLRQTLDAMRIVGLSEEEQDSVLQLVASVLHLGNIEFECNDDDEAIPADDPSWTALSMASVLLQVKEDDLLNALTTRTIDMLGEKIVKHLDIKGAVVSRDSLAKNIYSKLFDWLVTAINRKISALGQGQTGHRSIGILDIYGFESFKENSFEQLCINLANERLQQQFNQQVFKGEQDEYAREGIDWSYIEFVDNQDCLELLEGGPTNPSMAIFPLIDEACRLPKATHEDLAHSLRKNLASQGRFIAPKRPQHSFGVEHYAGRVTYLTNYIMDKNKDFVIKEHQGLMANSGSELLRELFAESEVIEVVPPKRGGKSAFKLNSVGLQFRKQLHGLMTALNKCQPHYIRCIKPNPESRPGSLTPPYVLEQLRAGGVLEAVRIASAGFPTRKPFRPFAQRYCVLLASGKGTYEPLDMNSLTDESAAKICRQVLQATKAEGWQMGKTRVFLRAGQLALLEGARGRRLGQSAIVIQSAFRCMAARRQLAHARRSASKIQAAWRGVLGRRLVLEARQERAVVRIQATWRMFKVRKAFLALKRNKAAVLIQSYVRMHQQRKRFRKATSLGKRQALRAAKIQKQANAAVVIQKNVRRRLAIQKALAIKAERARWLELETANAQLREELQSLKARFGHAAKRSDELAADNAQLQSEILASRLEIQNAVEQGNAKAALAKRNSSGLSQRLVQDLEAAQQAAQATLMSELEQSRRQKATAEERNRRAEEQVAQLKDQLRSLHNQLEDVNNKLQGKGQENEKLWDQMRRAATEYQAEFLDKEATINDLLARHEAEKEQIKADMMKARLEVEEDIEHLKASMQTEIEELQKETRVRFEAQREASEKSVKSSARVMALNSKITRLSNQLKESQAREASLKRELQEVRQASALQNMAPNTPQARSSPESNGFSNGIRSTPDKKPLLAQIDLPTQRSSIFDTLNTLDSPLPNDVREGSQNGANALTEMEESAVTVLESVVLPKKLPSLNIQYGSSQLESMDLPIASYMITECLINWAELWGPQAAEIVGQRLKTGIISNCENDALGLQSYWLVATLAIGSLVKYQSMGQAARQNLVKIGDGFIEMTDLHACLATSVMETLPLNMTDLFSQQAKDMARASSISHARSPEYEVSFFEAIGKSPWKNLLGSLFTVVETLRGEGAPPPLVKAVVSASLRYVDAELMNALMLRRDTCSTQAVTALQVGLNQIHGWAKYCGPAYCGKPEEIDSVMDHTVQAVNYILIVRPQCIKKAMMGEDVMGNLRASCSALTLQQIYRLTEHHHDDWISDDQRQGTFTLLRALKDIVDNLEDGGKADHRQSNGTAGSSDSTSGDDEDKLLLDPQAAFVLPRHLLNQSAKYFVEEGPTTTNPEGGKSLLEQTYSLCRKTIAIPTRLRNRAQFFLH